MRGLSGALVVAAATLLICCNADSHGESDGSAADPKRFSFVGHKNRLLHPFFEPNFLPEEVNLLKALEYISRRQNKLPMSPKSSGNYPKDYYEKRGPANNFDEIDRSELDTIANRKRNFDEIDRSSLPFPYAIKRFYHAYGNNFDLDTPLSSFDKKRYRPDYPMDEIDLSHFPIGSKRSLSSYPTPNQ